MGHLTIYNNNVPPQQQESPPHRRRRNSTSLRHKSCEMTQIQHVQELSTLHGSHIDHTLDALEYLYPLDPRDDTNGAQELGSLGNLPLEIIHMILMPLDIKSLQDFRCVNTGARLLVDSIPQFKRIIENAPASLRGSLSIGTARFFTCSDLYRSLCASKCSNCGDPGEYLYLMTCERVCFPCFTAHPRYQPLRPEEAMRQYGLRPEQLAKLPSMNSVPGIYSTKAIKCPQSLILIDRKAARKLALTQHGSVTALRMYEARMAFKRVEILCRGTVESKALHQEILASFDEESYSPTRFMGVVRAPVLDF